MNATDAERILGHRVRVRSSDLGYDGLEGKATGIATNFGPVLTLDIDGRRWHVPLEDIETLTELRRYRVTERGVVRWDVVAESNTAALTIAQQRAQRSPGAVYELALDGRAIGWATDTETGEAS